jgi:hypothetical protein
MNETEQIENLKQNEDKEDNFSDIEDDNNSSFQVNLDLVKNQTTTSNFKVKIAIVNAEQDEQSPKKSLSAKVDKPEIKPHQKNENANLNLRDNNTNQN